MKKVLSYLLLVAVALVAGAGKPKHPRGDGDRLSDYTMATIYWTGSAGDGNWNTVTNWSGGALPTTGDSVYVSRHARSGMFLNLDRTGDAVGAGLNLALFEIEEGFAHDIGTAGTYLQMAADEIMDRGSGNLFFKTDDGTSSIDTDLITIRKPDARGIAYLTDEGSTGSSNIAQLRVVGGSCKVATRLTLPLVYLTPIPGRESFTRLETDSADVELTNTYMSGGVFRCRNGSSNGALFLGGGDVALGNEASTFTMASIIQSGGRVRLEQGCNYIQVNNYTGFGGSFDGTAPTTWTSIMTLRSGPQFEYEFSDSWTVTLITLGD